MAKRRTRRGANSTRAVSGVHHAPAPQPPVVAPAGQGRLAIVALGLVMLTVATYAGVWSSGYVQLDDPTYVSQNPHLTGGLSWSGVQWAFTTGYAANWHPLTWLSHLLDVSLFGLDPGPQHVVNLVLHAANVALLFWLLAWVTGAVGRSAFVAALFAVHPLHVESVAWIAERKDVLSTLFWLLTIGAYVRYVRRPEAKRYALLLVTFALGLMAKPMLVTLPFVLLLMDVWPLNRTDNLFREKLPLFALAALSAAVTVIAQRGGSAVMSLDVMPLALRVENAIASYVGYIQHMFWPAPLVVYYAHPTSIPIWQAAAGVLALAGMSAVAIRLLKSRPYVAVGWFWYLGTLVPVIGLVQVGRQAMADRYTYAPLIGLFIAIAWGVTDLVARWPAPRWLLPIAAGVVLVPCTLLAHRQVEYWRSDESLWAHALEVRLGVDERVARMAAADLIAEHKLTALLALLETRPDNQPPRFTPAAARHFLGLLFARHNEPGDALAAYTDAIRLDPNAAEAHSDLALALAGQGRIADALPHFADAARLRPDSPDTHRNLGLALATAGRLDEAVREFQEVLRFKPDDEDVRRALADIAKRGKPAGRGGGR